MVKDFSNTLVERSQFKDEHNYIKRLFNCSKLTTDDLRRFILNWGNYTKIQNKELRGAIGWLQMEIKECTTEEEYELIKKFNKFNTMTEVAKNMGISQQAVSKKIKKICQKVAKVVVDDQKKLYI